MASASASRPTAARIAAVGSAASRASTSMGRNRRAGVSTNAYAVRRSRPGSMSTSTKPLRASCSLNEIRSIDDAYTTGGPSPRSNASRLRSW